MSVLRPLVLAVLPLFAGCQMLNLFSAPAPVSEQRIQGEISQKNGQLIHLSIAERAKRHVDRASQTPARGYPCAPVR